MAQNDTGERLARIEEALDNVVKGLAEIKSDLKGYDDDIRHLQMYNSEVKGRMAIVGLVCAFVGGLFQMGARVAIDKLAR
jgi:hypothetical protein